MVVAEAEEQVLTGCTNSYAAEFGRRQGKLVANDMTMGGVAAA